MSKTNCGAFPKTNSTPVTSAKLQAMYRAYCKNGSGGAFTFSDTSPSNPTVKDYWYNSVLNVLYKFIEDGSSSFWIQIS